MYDIFIFIENYIALKYNKLHNNVFKIIVFTFPINCCLKYYLHICICTSVQMYSAYKYRLKKIYKIYLSNILHMYIIFIICTYIHLYIIFVFVMTIVRMNECIYENIEFYKTIYILYVYIIIFGYIMKKRRRSEED